MLTQSKKTVLVLGGTSDIGIAVARKFASEKFNVILAGPEPFTYQWYLNNNSPVAGGTDSVLMLTNVKLADTGNYFVVITNYYGSVTSSIANLTLQPAFRPQAQVKPGGFQVSGTGVPGERYLLQGTPSLTPPVIWTSLGTNTAAPDGLVQLTDPRPVVQPAYFYRVISP